MSTGNGQQASPAFREREVAQLFHWIKDGESASVIGVSNIGKSNLFQYLLDPAAREHHLGEEACKYLFLRINFHNLPDFSCRSVYSLILDQMEMLDHHADDVCLPQEALAAIGKYHEAMLDAGQDELKIQRCFKLALRIYLLEPGRRLVLLFDQFDQLFQKAREQLFYNLRGLRDMYKYRISYLVFTRDPLPDLLPVTLEGASADDDGNEEDHDTLLFGDNGDKAREEFYELVQSNLLYLNPYQPGDAEQLLRGVARRKQLPLEESWIRPLYDLTGGHAGLLRMCYRYAASRWTQHGIEADPAAMLLVDSVRQECRRIWASLSDDEQAALVVQVKNSPIVDIDQAACAKLKLKGMLTEDGRVFSTLFEQFARDQKTRLGRLIYVDSRRQVVYYRDQPIKEPFSKTEYALFKKLYDHRDSVVSHEELLRTCWPNDDYDENTPPAVITANIYRIRKKLGISDKDKLIEVKPGKGYILNTEPPGKKLPRSSGE